MSDTTPHLGLPLVAAAQAQKHITHNEALELLDALVQLACLDKDLSAPPPSPREGDRYLVTAASPGGAWAGLSGQVARFADGVWTGSVPSPGWLAYVIDEADLYVFDGTGWTSFRRSVTAIQLTGRLGVNTTADATNRLAVKSDAALLSWDDQTPGSGDMRVAVNKRAAARDAGLVFQTGFSARALLGTLGGDDFALKVSADGAAFATALTASAANGGVDFASAETALASAATVDLGAAATRRVLVTGAGTIASFGAGANRERFLRFSGAATLTHDATRLVLPTRADIVAAADDTCIATSDAAGNWRVRHYQRADGTALAGTGAVASVAGRTGAVTLTSADLGDATALGRNLVAAASVAAGRSALAAAASGANGDITALSGLTTALTLGQGGTGAGTAAAALANLGGAPLASPALTGTPTAPTQGARDGSTRLATTAYADRGDAAAVARTPVADVAYAVTATDRTVAVTALTAARTLTLPAASAYPQGVTLVVVDESGACSAANAITLARAGPSDAINGLAAIALVTPFAYLALQSNGANKWTVVDRATVTTRNVFVDVLMDNGTATYGASFTRLPLATVNQDTGGNWDATNYWYTCPRNGVYLITGTFRVGVSGSIATNSDFNKQYGLGVYTSEADGAWFLWHATPPSGGAIRSTYAYSRLSYQAAGDRLRMFTFSDQGIVGYRAGLQIALVSEAA